MKDLSETAKAWKLPFSDVHEAAQWVFDTIDPSRQGPVFTSLLRNKVAKRKLGARMSLAKRSSRRKRALSRDAEIAVMVVIGALLAVGVIHGM